MNSTSKMGTFFSEIKKKKKVVQNAYLVLIDGGKTKPSKVRFLGKDSLYKGHRILH